MAESFQHDENNDLSSVSESSFPPRSPFNPANWSYYENEEHEFSVDLSYLNLDGGTLHQSLDVFNNSDDTDGVKRDICCVYLQHNLLDYLPDNIYKFRNVRHLDLSNNSLKEINEAVFELGQLEILVARNNLLCDSSLPKKFGLLQRLEELNLSGNFFKTIPLEVMDVRTLKSLYMGDNQLEEVPRSIWKLDKLEILYLGGNALRDIPAEVGRLHALRSLVLCENQLLTLPSTISCLRRLRSLMLHRNQLTTLPPEIVTLKGLVELSLRDNPLVGRFIQDMVFDPPSLRELSARSIKLFKVPFRSADLPQSLATYLQSACRCVNPKCRGVYFDVRVEHIKFVDFCGKYRIPLLQYLCSPRCTPSVSDSSDDDSDVPESRLRRVLLG